MWFEFSIAKKYLLPRKRQLSLSLIALMSVTVISLVVWLVLVFLSVTDGIEKGWLKKLTSLNAPIQITPTEEYFRSYYYQVDGISGASSYSLKSLREKKESLTSDPYSPIEDEQIPSYWPEKLTNPDGSTKDLVKSVFDAIDQVKQEIPQLVAEDYEVSGALLKLRMIRPHGRDQTQGYLTQVSYLSSFSEQNPSMPHLLESPRIEDLNYLLYLSSYKTAGTTNDNPQRATCATVKQFQSKISALFANLTIHQLKTENIQWQLPLSLLPEGKSFSATPHKRGGIIQYMILSEHQRGEGKLEVINQKLRFTSQEGEMIELGATTPLYIDHSLIFDVETVDADIQMITKLGDIKVSLKGTLQGHPLQGTIGWEGLELYDATAKTTFETLPTITPLWPYQIGNRLVLPESENGEVGMVLPKHFQSSGVKIGDRGYFSYGAATTSSMQEMRLENYVAGFYDPGVMAIGAKCILTAPQSIHDINLSTQSQTYDKHMINGIHVYFPDLNHAQRVKDKLVHQFKEAGIVPYFTITTFHEYDFAKDLL